MMNVEISLTIIISVIALALSAYSISVSKKRGDNTDMKELSKTLATLETKIDAIEKAVLGKPTLSEEVAVSNQIIKDHERRIKELENRRQS